MAEWSNLGKVVYKRTYARKDSGKLETWEETVDRVIAGNLKNQDPKTLLPNEEERLKYYLLNRKAGPAGRGWWFSGAPAHNRIGGSALTNCWFLTADQYKNFVIAQDLLMLGGGVGLSVEHRFVTHLPKVKKDVFIFSKDTRDADFIVPDSREGWCELTRRVLQSYLEDGKSFSYSTKCLRGHGEVIKGFGGKASGPQPLKDFITNLCALLESRAGKHIRPIDAADIICLIGQMVVAGNVRRSALLILGDPWDKEYLKSKRWDLGPIPPHRAMANFSVVIDDVEDLHKSFWDTYKQGEPFGICNRKNMQKYGRMGERKKDSAIGLNPCVTGDTEVLTDKGYFQIQDLVGTEVNIWNGFEFSAVKPSITGHNRKILNIKFSDGRELKCTPNHKFHLSRGYHGQTEIVEALDLSIGDKLIKHEFPVIKEGVEYDKDKMYSQGFYSADGTKNSNNINLYGDKRKLAKYLLGKLGSAVQENQFGTERQIFTLSFRPKEKNYVPLEANLESRLAWLAGVLDGDGCELKEGGFQLSSIDYTFLLDVQKLLSISGVNSKIVKGMEESYRDLPDGKGGYSKFLCKENNRICVGAAQVQILKDLGLSTKRLSFEKSPNRDASRFNQVIGIEDLGEVDTVYCFTEPKRNLGCFNGVVTGQCAEATLENYEPCNLQEIWLPNLKNENEFIEAARLMHRWGKRVTCEPYHNPENDEVVKRNRRIGTGITGCLQAPKLFNKNVLDKVYESIQKENESYSRKLGIPKSIRTTVIKPSGTLSLVGDTTPGIHPSYSRYYIRRVRFSSNDPLIPVLRSAGHPIEPVKKFDGTLDHNTLVVDFFCQTPEGTPVADEDFNTWQQLDTLLLAQKHWADQAVSVTVYYTKEDLPKLKEWLADNLKYLKSISFLLHSDHGFEQAPLEAIDKEQYEKSITKLKDIDVDEITGEDLNLEDCEEGHCPVK